MSKKNNNKLNDTTTKLDVNLDTQFCSDMTSSHVRQSRSKAVHHNNTNILDEFQALLVAEVNKQNKGEVSVQYLPEHNANATREHKPSHMFTVETCVYNAAGKLESKEHAIQVYDSGLKVILNANAPYNSNMKASGTYPAKAALNVVAKLHTNEVMDKYDHVEIGLVTYAAAAGKTASQYAARISWQYKGTDANFLECKPRMGCNILQQRNGKYSVQYSIPEAPMSNDKISFNSIKGDITQYFEAMYLDAYLKGEYVEILPNFKKNTRNEAGQLVINPETGKNLREYFPEAIRNYIMAYEENYTATPAQASRNSGARIAAAIMRNEVEQNARETNALLKVIPATKQAELKADLGANTIKVTDETTDALSGEIVLEGNTYPVTELYGRWLRVMHDGFQIKARQYVSAQTLVTVMEYVNNPEYHFEACK